MDINQERLALTFIRLCETDSPSRSEGRMAALLTEMLCTLGADAPFEDDSAKLTEAECGNLFFRFPGTLDREPLFFNCHLDTVEPGTGVKVVRKNDMFTSHGETILGSDDKSGIAALVEALHIIRENKLPHIPMEYVFTTCEEIGLLGAKAIDPANIRAKTGYALDSSGFGRVIIGAPAANRLNITVKGVAAHAGLHPEWGINAITLAAEALASSPLGRIDEESTVNFGTIRGGAASNIVPEQVTIAGEVRSHSPEKLRDLTGRVEQAFRQAIQKWHDPAGEARGVPQLDFRVTEDFPALLLEKDDAVIQIVDKAARAIDMDLRYEIAGGGSDANIFNGLGLQTAIIATGMTHVHSTEEHVSLRDMADLTRLLLALMT
ncbi:MAG: peptidase M20 [Desulfobulbus sp.]|nr:MAG: peptidase M20 [Desulfobulbus sp.]